MRKCLRSPARISPHDIEHVGLPLAVSVRIQAEQSALAQLLDPRPPVLGSDPEPLEGCGKLSIAEKPPRDTAKISATILAFRTIVTIAASLSTLECELRDILLHGLVASPIVSNNGQ